MDLLLRLVADGLLIVIIAISAPLLLYWLRNNTWVKLSVLIMAGLTSLFVAKLMSLLYQPTFARPFLELGVEPGAAYINNPGFPSDHALFATVVVVSVYVATRNTRLSLFLATLLLFMIVGRVVALVHTPLDVVVGVITGLSGSLWYRKLTS